MKRFTVTRTAKAQIDEIWLYIATDNVSAADNWVVELEKTFALIGQTPRIGRVRKELGRPSLLVWSFKKYLVIYRERAPGAQIISVLHGARDLPTLLDDLGR